jgi:pimeloyl-ACP methyl ester carboxylesterase
LGPSIPGFEDHVQAILAALDGSGWDRIVLVGHSLSGLLVPEVAARRPDVVTHLVLVACFVPPVGGTLLDSLRRWEAVGLRVRLRSSASIRLPRPLARRMFCSDLDPDRGRFVLENLVPEPLSQLVRHRFETRIPPGVGCTYIKLLDDRAIPPDRQDANIANVPGADVVPLRAGHDAMVSRPEELAAVLNRIAAG